MDPLPSFDQATPTTVHSGVADTPSDSTRQRDRRREKQQLSCNFCRSRKIRCDRQLPCKTCVNKDVADSCTYTPGPQRKTTIGVGDRIHQLEALVRSLMNHQQQQQQPCQQSNNHDSNNSTSPVATELENMPMHSHSTNNVGSEDGCNATSPVASEHGNMHLHAHGATYVSYTHWAAILDSISELNDVYESEREVAIQASNGYIPHYSPGPRLLYEPVHATKEEILSSIPARAVVDRMVARYFNTQGAAPAVLSSAQFLREYEDFWQDPGSTPFSWIGLLFSIMCLSSQYQQKIEDPADHGTSIRVYTFRERTVHCLVLGQFTKGGPHVLETMIIHVASEVFMYKDAEIGLWLLLGMVVQLALSLGYHRDPRNFSHISPFDGEMRRRVWAAIVQMDLRLSSQMGLPRMLKSQQCDTAEPRNLLDSDFDETSTELPPSRPETEVTPVLYGLAKIRIDRIGSLITDLVADTREHPLPEIMQLDAKLNEAQASLPPIFRWQPLSKCLMVPPQIVLHRLVLQLAVQRLTIALHRRYLSASYAAEECYDYSRSACVRAAINILEFQQLVHEETQPDGLLYPLVKSATHVPLDREKILDLLRNTYPIWLRLSAVSHDAGKAVEHLSLVLGLRQQQEQTPTARAAAPDLSTTASNQIAWDAYHGIAGLSQMFDPDLMAWDNPNSSANGNMFSTEWLLDGQLDQ